MEHMSLFYTKGIFLKIVFSFKGIMLNRTKYFLCTISNKAASTQFENWNALYRKNQMEGNDSRKLFL